jgi:MFS family permease
MVEKMQSRGTLLNICIGAMIFVLLGSLWALFGLWSLHTRYSLSIAIPFGLCALLLLILGIISLRKVRRLPHDILSGERRARVTRIKRRFALVNLFQGIAIAMAFTFGFNLHHPEYIPPVVALVVGLHFLALAPILQMRFDYLIGTLLCLLSLITIFGLPTYVDTSNPSVRDIFLWGAVTGIGSAIVLWMGAVSRLIKARAGARS